MEKNNKKYKFTFSKFITHLSTIIRHKYYVFKYCCMCGIPIRGLLHDLSKFSPTEFFTNVKYTEKGISPIDIQKKEIGFSFAWQHHKGHNPHHYEFWMDKFDDGCYVTRMPYKYMVECLCDFLGAAKTYNPGSTFEDKVNWWNKQRTIRNMHPDNIEFIDIVFGCLSDLERVKRISDISCIDWDIENGDYFRLVEIKDILHESFLSVVYNKCIKNETQVKIKNNKI